jgi:hypothetical protein
MIFGASPSRHCHPSAGNEPVIVLKPLLAPGDLLFVAARKIARRRIPGYEAGCVLAAARGMTILKDEKHE